MQLHPDPVGNHCDEFRIGRLAAAVLDGVAEVGIEDIHIPAPQVEAVRSAPAWLEEDEEVFP